MTPLSFVFAVHNHQPVGNFEAVFVEAYDKAYKPFQDVLERHPGIKTTQHWSGPLLEWIVRRHPEMIERMKDMVARGQLELLTGAYYEAILAMIPEEDRIGQIQKLTEYLHKTFGVWPRGMWLAERVWEPHLAASLVRAEVEYVMLDDSHFRHTGLSDADLLGYYVTEELGETLKVLPMDRHLRYAIPFHTVPRTLEYLTERAKRFPGKAIVHADDGEKFGVWPGTHTHVYTEGWLENFCQALEGASASIQTVRACDLIDAHPPLGRTYLPTDSYGEMTRWALPPQAQLGLEQFEVSLEAHGLLEGNREHVRGGFWRTFLAKYPEANQMQKRMLRVASRIRGVAREHRIPQEVFDHLWAGQCNDGYWHGLFGGLYLPSLRFTTYRHLITADQLLDTLTEHKDLIIIEEADCDGDGEAEVIVESSIMNLYVKPSLGGCLVELDYKPSGANLLDVLSRREEGNHRKLIAVVQGSQARGKWDELLAKEPDLISHIVFDWYRHACFLDHAFSPDTSLEAFARQTYRELGDFVNQPYGSTLKEEGEHVYLSLVRDGGIWRDGQRHPLRIRKDFHFALERHEIRVDYILDNLGDAPVDFMFGVELAAGGMAGNAPDRYVLINGERPERDSVLQGRAAHDAVRTFGVADEWLGAEVRYALEHQATLWRFPLETVSLSEAGFERLYQGTILMPHWPVRLEAAQAVSWRTSLTLTAKHA